MDYTINYPQKCIFNLFFFYLIELFLFSCYIFVITKRVNITFILNINNTLKNYERNKQRRKNFINTKYYNINSNTIIKHLQNNNQINNIMETEAKKYIGTYKVVKFFRTSRRRQILKKGLTREEAQRVVKSYPDSDSFLVGFEKQFTADKYFI